MYSVASVPSANFSSSSFYNQGVGASIRASGARKVKCRLKMKSTSCNSGHWSVLMMETTTSTRLLEPT